MYRLRTATLWQFACNKDKEFFSLSLLHSHRCFLGSILERSAVESRKQIDALKNKNDSYMIIWSILIPPIRRILVDASAVKSIGELFHAPNPPDSEIESTTLRIQVRWKWPMAQAPRS